jgi:hypothetical protein
MTQELTQELRQELRQPLRMKKLSVSLAILFSAVGALPLQARSQSAEKNFLWKPVSFAIVKFNDEAPKSWNMYHTDKKGLLLLHLWKRYLLLDIKEEEAFEIDPQTVKPAGDNVEWSLADKPDQALETPEWKTRDLGSLERIRFRLGKNGYILELQIPLLPTGKPVY